MGRRAGGSLISSNLWSNLHPEEHGFAHLFHSLFLSPEDNRKAFLHCCLAQGVQMSPPARPPARGKPLYLPLSCKPGTAMGCAQQLLLLWRPPGLLLTPQCSAGSLKQPSLTPALI